MNAFKKTLALGATAALLSLPLAVGAQTSGDTGTGDTVDTTDTTASTGTESTTLTPGVPSTGVGPSQAAANAVLLGISAVTALVGGYFLTTGRKKVA